MSRDKHVGFWGEAEGTGGREAGVLRQGGGAEEEHRCDEGSDRSTSQQGGGGGEWHRSAFTLFSPLFPFFLVVSVSHWFVLEVAY